MAKRDIFKRIKSILLRRLFPESFKRRRHIKDYFFLAKNGVITGAADNDPAGIVTYTQVGALTGFSLLWLMILTTPLLAALEDISARIGVVTKKSLPFLISSFFGKKIALLIVVLVAFCNVVTIGADIAGMSELLAKVAHAPWSFFAVLLTLFFGIMLLGGRYITVSRFLFLLTPLFLSYLAVSFLVKPNFKEILQETFVPFTQNPINYWTMALALVGTTLTPYLVFWQNTEEIEEKKQIGDLKKESLGVKIGMVYCNLISCAIILVGGAILFSRGLSVETVADAALVLKPLVGKFAFSLFFVGLLGAGLLAVPVLASSTAYIFSDIFLWEEGLDKKVWQAKGFYMVLLFSLLAGLFTIFLGISPVKMLVYSQILNGAVMPIIIYFLLKISNNKEIMGVHTNKAWVNFSAWLAFFVVLSFEIGLIANFFSK